MSVAPADSSSWDLISPYLDRVLELEAREREQWLAELTITQPQVAGAVRAFLAECESLDAKGFLDASPLSLARLEFLVPALEEALRQRTGVESADWLRNLPDFEQASTAGRLAGVAEGAVLGAYRLIREIGHGGMSSVWLAERCDGQLKREVALKLPYEGPPRAHLAERLQRERDILATLTHPNIATLYDAGVTPAGQPYLALEYVQGTTLRAYCDAARLSIRERLKVFQQVLSAVEFAHEHLVLHRDLKPSNILVTEHGRVVLLDFGIAKLLSRDVDHEAPLTEMAGRVLTPDYASPEHIAGRVLGTPSDIYSLGVVLCELLAGSRPFGSQHESRQAFEEKILKQDPPKPSQLALTEEIATARGTTPRKLMQILKGDLDTIVLKALKKEPAERYRSVATFEQDIVNYLGHLPVSARPDSAWYRIRRFASRHKLQVAAAGVTLLAIVGGAAISIWQAREAARERDRAFALASRNEALNDFSDTLITEAAEAEKPVTVSEMLTRSEELALADTSGTPENRAAVLDMIALRYASVGDTGKSAKLLERALALVRESHDVELRSTIVCDHASIVAQVGETDLATREITGELGKLDPDSRTAAVCLLYLSYIAYDSGDATAHLRYALQALKGFRAAPRTIAAEEGVFLAGVADAYLDSGNTREADRYFQLALRKFTDTGRGLSREAMILRSNWAHLDSSAGAPKRALDLYDQIMSGAKEPYSNSLLPASSLSSRARVLELIGRFDQARVDYERCQQQASEQRDVQKETLCLVGLASIAVESRDPIAAANYLKQSEKPAKALPADSVAVKRQAWVQGRLSLAQGDIQAARAHFDRALVKGSKNVGTIEATLGKAEVELLSGNVVAAIANAQTALDIATTLQGGIPHSNRAGLSWLMLGRALKEKGDDVQARKAFEAAVTQLSNTVDANHPALMQARQLLASAKEPDLPK
jgi:serine/threonine-protein kinase